MDSKDHTTNMVRLRVVIDTDVLISGLLSDRGPAREIVDRWLAGEFALLASEQMLSECERILEHLSLKEGLGLTINPKDDLIAMLKDQAQRVETTLPALTRVVRNPFDEAVLMSAITGHADYLVTEEDDLLALKQYEGVRIVAPERFIQSLGEQPSLPGLL